MRGDGFFAGGRIPAASESMQQTFDRIGRTDCRRDGYVPFSVLFSGCRTEPVLLY